MDPIALIITALTEGLAAAAKDVVSDEIKAGYQKLKGMVLRKFGDKGVISSTLTLLGINPDSVDVKKMLSDELTNAGAAQDDKLLEQARIFLALLEKAGTSYSAEARDKSIIVQGKKNKVKVTYQTAPSEPDWETGYLHTLIAHCDPLDLSPIDETRSQSSDAAESIRISDVFTTLYLEGVTRYPDQSIAEALAPQKDSELPLLRAKEREKEPLPIQALEAIAALPRLVILGKPGGGKTTLVNHLAAQLAKQRLDQTAKAQKLPGWTDNMPTLPVRIILRRFAAWLPTDVFQGNCGQVWNYLEHRLGEWGGKEAFIPLKQKLFEKGGVIVFDGLDEVSQTDAETKRTIIKEAIAQFSKALPKCKIIVTCREYAYQKGDAWRLPEIDFPEVRLALFAPEQIKAFTQTWYRTVGPKKGWGEDKCRAEAEHLNNAIETFPHLQELAPYPLLLTLMAQVHGRDGNLPEDRADLYEKATNLLLSHWENRIVRDIKGNRKIEPGLVMQLGIRGETLRSALERAAFEAHERQEKDQSRREQCADIPKEDLRDILEIELGSDVNAKRVIDYIQTRSGLLQAEDQRIYRFPHRTFQEYLAATHILKRNDPVTMLRTRVRRDLNWWREVFLLAAGASRNSLYTISNLVNSLLPEKPQGQTVAPEQAALAQLSAQALHETGFADHVRKEKLEEPGLFSQTFESVQSRLLTALTADQSLAPKDRAASGNALNWLGDPRSGVGVHPETGLPDIEFRLVPKGPFWMGSENGDADEKPQHLNECLDYDYWMARYPVTVNQFRAFVEKSGYQPGDRDCLKGLGNNPVVWVNWHEAQAFCRWLTEVWRTSRDEAVRLPKGYVVRLPSEAEWEKAARGGLEIPEQPVIGLPGGLHTPLVLRENTRLEREHPWGKDSQSDKADANKANYDDSGIGKISPVGCFSSGAGPYGCLDMSGNVWEWTRSLWGKDWENPDFRYPYRLDDGRENVNEGDDVRRVLRGGSFYFNEWSLRCSCRYRGSPDARDFYLGFRLVVAPGRLVEL